MHLSQSLRKITAQISYVRTAKLTCKNAKPNYFENIIKCGDYKLYTLEAFYILHLPINF